MPLLLEEKAVIISEHKRHDTDTGSSEVQIALLTTRIKMLTEHLKVNKKDYSCRRSLLKMVGHRRRLLKYLKKEDEGTYKSLIGKLGLRK